MNEYLGQSLRAWRDRLSPAEAGLPRTGVGRAPGLRREEVASLTGISISYLVRLEQGHATPSVSVVAALARALRLTTEETGHLYMLAGHSAPSDMAARHLTPSVQRILDRFPDVPFMVYDAAWTIVAANDSAHALLGENPVGQNSARRQFVGPPFIAQGGEGAEQYERDIVADLRGGLAKNPGNKRLVALIDELRQSSPRFASLWAVNEVRTHATARKTFLHPTVGSLTLDCDSLAVVGTDLRVTLWSAPPNTPDADALALLNVVGAQQI